MIPTDAFRCIVTNGPIMNSGIYLGSVLRAMFDVMTPEQQAEVLTVCGMEQYRGDWSFPPKKEAAPKEKPRSVWSLLGM